MRADRRPESSVQLLGWLLAVGLAAGGQWLLASGGSTGAGALLLALALLPAAAAWGARPLTPQIPLSPIRPARTWLLVPVPALAMLGWLGAAGNQFTTIGVVGWLGAVACWLAAWRIDQRTAGLAPSLPWRRREVALFGAILGLAAWLRFWQLDGLPAEMTSDHAEKLLDVWDVLAGERPIFFERNTGREPLQFYLTALLAGPLGLGLSHLALKVGTATISLLTVPLTYLMAARGLGLSRGVALLAAALLATSKWHISISRVGLRFPFAPFGVALTLWFFFRALRGGARRDWLLSGVALGIALYGYTPARMLPLLLVAGMGLWLLRRAQPAAITLTNLALLPATSALVFLPLLRYSIDRPDQFWYRSLSRAAADPAAGTLSVLWMNIVNGLRMFHIQGDEVWVNTLPYDPVLDRVTGVLLVVGLGMLAAAALRGRRPADGTLLLALPVLLLPSLLALGWPQENPSVVRAGGMLPPLMVVAALPLGTLMERIAGWGRGRAGGAIGAAVGGGAMVVLVVWIAFLNARIYFGPYAREYDARSWNSTEVAALILDHEAAIGGVNHAYIASWPHWIDSRNVAFNLGHPEWDSVLANPRVLFGRPPLPYEPRLVVMHPDDRATRQLLTRIWPGARVREVESRVDGKQFVVVIHPDVVE